MACRISLNYGHVSQGSVHLSAYQRPMMHCLSPSVSEACSVRHSLMGRGCKRLTLLHHGAGCKSLHDSPHLVC